jgi:hypothetical protein
MIQTGGFVRLMEKRAKRSRAGRVPKSYNLDLAVVRFVEDLSEEEERSQSTIVNRIIKEYAALKGTPLPASNPEAGAPASE